MRVGRATKPGVANHGEVAALTQSTRRRRTAVIQDSLRLQELFAEVGTRDLFRRAKG